MALYRDADSADQAVSHLANFPRVPRTRAPGVYELQQISQRQSVPRSARAPGRLSGGVLAVSRSREPLPRCHGGGRLGLAGQYPPQVIATALATGNADAMLLFGWSQATTAKATESAPIMAAAWVLAACRSGANCGPTNDVLPLAICGAGIELGCTERYTAIDELTASLGSRDLAEANLLALDIEGSMRYRNPERLMKYLPF